MAVNIYAASAQELRTLEGVWEKKADRIIKLRESLSYRGKFSCWNPTTHKNNSTVGTGKQIVVVEDTNIAANPKKIVVYLYTR